MADQKPPQLCVGEMETFRALLQYQRESFVRKLNGVDEAVARRSVVESGTTLFWLARHMAHAERTWVLVRFAGHPKDEAETGSERLGFYRVVAQR